MKRLYWTAVIGLGLLACGGAIAAEPLFRVGIVTDTHLNGDRPDPIERLRRAYRLFRDKEVALIANCGDFACKFDPVAYGHYAAIRRETYPDPSAAPKEVYVWADHDWVAYPGAKGNEAWARGFADVRRLLGIDHDMYAHFALNGFEFLVFPELADMTRYEREIAAAEKRAGVGRPVFVFEHAPAFGTTEASRDWGATNRLAVLSRHPQVIAINGHSHGSLRNERNIWQGAFTSVSAGCLAHWMEQLPGVPGVRMYWSWGCLVMEVYPDRAVFRRYDLQEGEEIGAGDPWAVAWPHDSVRPRYSPACCAERAAKPSFPPQARLVLKPDSTQAFECVEVSFPAAGPGDTVFCHRLKIERRDADGRWSVLASRDLRAEYHLPARQRKVELSDTLTAAYFEDVDVCRISVTPVDFWGNCGRPLETVWKVPPTRPWKTVWEGVPEGCEKAVRFGWSGHWKLPDCVARGVPKGAKLRVTADLDLRQSDRRGAIVLLRGLDSGETAFTVRTPPGESDLRYAGEFIALGDKRQELSVRFGAGGRLVVRRLRLEMRPCAAIAGETLYNGIVLPSAWPPRAFDSLTCEVQRVPYLENRPAVVPIDVGRQLFVDDFLIERTDLRREWHHPVKFAGNPILKPETPLEINRPSNSTARVTGGGVWWDPTRGVYRMWYEAGWLNTPAYAESDDGLAWRRVNLDVVPGTNRVLPEGTPRFDGWVVTPDFAAAEPYANWRMFVRPPGPGAQTAYVATSKDGLHWSELRPAGACGDASSLFYNPFRRKWVFSLRNEIGPWGKGGSRIRSYREADDFLSGAQWDFALGRSTDDVVLWLQPDALEPRDPVLKLPPQLYDVAATAYESLMVGGFAVWKGPENDEITRRGLPKITDLCFAFSRDGYHFSREDRTPAVAAERWTSKKWDAGYIRPMPNLLVVQDERILVYYGAMSGNTNRLENGG